MNVKWPVSSELAVTFSDGLDTTTFTPAMGLEVSASIIRPVMLPVVPPRAVPFKDAARIAIRKVVLTAYCTEPHFHD